MNSILIYVLMFLPQKEETIEIKKSYDVKDPAALTVMINNIYGSVEVEPSNTGKVELELTIHLRASSDDLIEKAKRELSLGEVLGDDSIIFYTDAPFIQYKKERRYDWMNWDEDPKYSFRFEYKLKVPQMSSVYAKAINKGNVLVKDIHGWVTAQNVNGDVDVIRVRKLRKAGSVNGQIAVSFIESPSEPIEFNSVNGDFILEFPNDFAARVYHSTMNGEMFSAFDYREADPLIEKGEKGTKFKIKSIGGIEIGQNGPTLSFKSINGDVYLKKLTQNQ